MDDIGWAVTVGACVVEGKSETEGVSLGAGEVVGCSESHLGKELISWHSSRFQISGNAEQSMLPFNWFPPEKFKRM